MKICSRCKEEKELKNFSWKSKQKQKYCANCKQCQALYHRKHYEANTDKYKQQARAYKKLQQEKVLQFLKGKKCKICGFSNILALEFHHVDSSTKINDVGFLIAQHCSWNTIYEEIKKCDILCANCHRIITLTSNNSYRCVDSR